MVLDLLAFATCLTVTAVVLGPERVLAESPVPANSTTNASTRLMSDLEKMPQARMSSAVLIAYIEHWTAPYLTSVDDLLTLRKRGATPEILNAFARGGAELRLQARQSQPKPP